MIEITDGGLESIPRKLLPWDNIKIKIITNPANCDTNMDWLFRNRKYDINTDKDDINNRNLGEWCKCLF